MANLTLAGVMESLAESFVKENVQTALPARIIDMRKFESDQLVTVQPLVNRVDEDGVILEVAYLYDVPILFPSAGNGILSFPVKLGDTVMLVVSSRSLDDLIDSEAPMDSDYTITPADNRSFNVMDAVAIPGLYPKKFNLHPDPTNVELKLLDSSGEPVSSLKFTPEGDVLLTNTKDTTITSTGAVKVVTESTVDVQAAKDVTVSTEENVTISAAKSITISNGNGSFTLNENGTVDINGTTISPTGEIVAAGPITSGGDVTTSGGISLDSHKHTGSPTAPDGPISDTGAPK